MLFPAVMFRDLEKDVRDFSRSKAMDSSQCDGHPCRNHRSGGGVLPSATGRKFLHIWAGEK